MNPLNREKEKVFVTQIVGANIFMIAEDHRPIKIKGLDITSTDVNTLQELIWNRFIKIKKLYIDENNCILSEVFVDDEPIIKKLIKNNYGHCY